MAYYKFKYSELELLARSMKLNAQKQIEALNSLQAGMSAFADNEKISGGTADAMKSYFPAMYSPILNALKILVNHQAQECIRYVKAYGSSNMGGATQIYTAEQAELTGYNNNSIRKWQALQKSTTQHMDKLASEVAVCLDSSHCNFDEIISVTQNLNKRNADIIQIVDAIENQYKKPKDDYIVQLKSSINALFKKMRATTVPNYTTGNIDDFLNSPEATGMRLAAIALWYYSYQTRNDSEDLGLGEMFKKYEGLDELYIFDEWLTENDIEMFRSLQYVPFEDWPDEYKTYFYSFNNYPRNGNGGNCTWYAFGRFMMMQGVTFEDLPGGDAFDWVDVAAERGYKTGWKPTVGSILCWSYGTGSDGHVAVVEKIIKPNSKYPYGAVIISQSSWSGSGPAMFLCVDTCPINQDGSIDMVMNKWTRTSATYRGCIYPERDLISNFNTPFGKATAAEKNFVKDLADGNRPVAYDVSNKGADSAPSNAHDSAHDVQTPKAKENPDPKTNNTQHNNDAGKGKTDGKTKTIKGDPDPKTNGTVGRNISSGKDNTAKANPDPKMNKDLRNRKSDATAQSPKTETQKPKTETQQGNTHHSDQGPRTVGGNFRTGTPPQPSSEVFEDHSGLDSANDRKNVVKDALDYGQSQTHTNAAFNLDRMGVPPQTSQPVTRLSELDMESLQRKLGVTVDGDLGPETISAIQKEVGATVDGYWGTETSAKMQEYLGVEVDGYASTETLTALNEWATK